MSAEGYPGLGVALECILLLMIRSSVDRESKAAVTVPRHLLAHGGILSGPVMASRDLEVVVVGIRLEAEASAEASVETSSESACSLRVLGTLKACFSNRMISPVSLSLHNISVLVRKLFSP